MTLPPDLPDRLNAEGLVHAEAGRDVLAERAFRSALALAPTHLAAAGNLATRKHGGSLSIRRSRATDGRW